MDRKESPYVKRTQLIRVKQPLLPSKYNMVALDNAFQSGCSWGISKFKFDHKTDELGPDEERLPFAAAGLPPDVFNTSAGRTRRYCIANRKAGATWPDVQWAGRSSLHSFLAMGSTG